MLANREIDELDKQLLLTIQSVCNMAGIKIPWDKVGQSMGNNISEGAVVQHLAKLRQRMSGQGLDVPPPLKRGSTKIMATLQSQQKTRKSSRLGGTAENGEDFDIDEAYDSEEISIQTRSKQPKPKPDAKHWEENVPSEDSDDYRDLSYQGGDKRKRDRRLSASNQKGSAKTVKYTKSGVISKSAGRNVGYKKSKLDHKIHDTTNSCDDGGSEPLSADDSERYLAQNAHFLVLESDEESGDELSKPGRPGLMIAIREKELRERKEKREMNNLGGVDPANKAKGPCIRVVKVNKPSSSNGSDGSSDEVKTPSNSTESGFPSLALNMNPGYSASINQEAASPVHTTPNSATLQSAFPMNMANHRSFDGNEASLDGTEIHGRGSSSLVPGDGYSSVDSQVLECPVHHVPQERGRSKDHDNVVGDGNIVSGNLMANRPGTMAYGEIGYNSHGALQTTSNPAHNGVSKQQNVFQRPSSSSVNYNMTPEFPTPVGRSSEPSYQNTWASSPEYIYRPAVPTASQIQRAEQVAQYQDFRFREAQEGRFLPSAEIFADYVLPPRGEFDDCLQSPFDPFMGEIYGLTDELFGS